MKQAAMKENISKRLPQAKAGDRAESNQAEEVVNPRSGPYSQKEVNQRLHQEDAGADEHKQLDAGRDKSAPIEVVTAGAERSRHIQSLRRWIAPVKVPRLPVSCRLLRPVCLLNSASCARNERAKRPEG